MSDRIRCSCRRCTIRSLMGPAIVITVGVLFLLSQMHPGYLNFRQTWPVILLVIGAVSLASSVAPMDGHISGDAPPPTSLPPAPTSGANSGSFPGQGQA